MRDVAPFLAGFEGGILKNSNSDKVVQLYSLLWIRGKSTIDFKSIFQYDDMNLPKRIVGNCFSFSQLMFEYQNEVLEFCANKNVFHLYNGRRPYEVSAMVFMLKNLVRWNNWLFSEIHVHSASIDERLLQVLPSCIKRCDSVLIAALYENFSYELMKVVPFIKKVAAIWVSYGMFGVAVDYIGKAISNTGECKLQHLTYTVIRIADSDGISEFPKDIINGILEFSHVLETVTVLFMFRCLIPQNWIDQSHAMMNDVNKSISNGLMGELQRFVIDLHIIDVMHFI